MLKYLLKIFLLCILFIVAPAACGLIESCPTDPYFSINGIEIQHSKYIGTGQPPWIEVDEGLGVEWDKHFLKVLFTASYYSENRLGGANLFAFDCAPPGISGSKVGVSNLFIISLTDYNNEFIKNDTLNNIVGINEISYSIIDDFDNFYSVENYLEENKDVIKEQGFALRILEPPSLNNSEQQFKLIYILSNGETFTTTTKIAKLTI